MPIATETIVLLVGTLVNTIGALAALYISLSKLKVEKKALGAEADQEQASVIESSAKSSQQWIEIYDRMRANTLKSDDENLVLKRQVSENGVRVEIAEHKLKDLSEQFEQKTAREQNLMAENRRLSARVTELSTQLDTERSLREQEKMEYAIELKKLRLEIHDLHDRITKLSPVEPGTSRRDEQPISSTV